MAKKRSFADKAGKAEQKKAFSMVRYVKAAVSEKTGRYRFQESMLKVPTGMTLDAYLAELKKGRRGETKSGTVDASVTLSQSKGDREQAEAETEDEPEIGERGKEDTETGKW